MSGEPDLPEDDLHAYVDGALPASRRLEVERLLASDPDATRRVAALAAQRGALRAALAPIAAEPVPANLDLRRLLAERGRPGEAVPRRDRRRLAAAAAALVCIGAAAGWFARGAGAPPSNGLAALSDEAFIMYAAYAPDRLHPVEFGAEDKAELLRWIGNRLRRPVTVPDLAASGFRFMGGRVVATPHGPAAMFMYDDDRGTRICLFLRPMEGAATMPMRPDARGDTKGFAWVGAGIGYDLIGPVGARDLHPVANDARRQLGQDA